MTIQVKNIALVFIFVLLAAIPASLKAQTISDRDLKTGLVPLSNSASNLSKLQPLKFQYNHAKFQRLKLPSGNQYGFMAEDVEKVFPEAIKSEGKFYLVGKNNYRTETVKTIDYEKFIPILVGAINEQQVEIDKLKKEVQDLKAKK